MTTGTRTPGDFCWINMLTPRPVESCQFYSGLLGWTYGEIPGHGFSIKVGGKDVGGLFDREGPNTPKGPPLIGVMLKVESADATAEKISALGGRAAPPFDIPGAGRMAVCFDPNGAEFDVWEPRTMPGTEVDRSRHGAPTWFETLTTDTARAGKFYCDLFGWSTRVQRMAGFDYTSFLHQGTPIAGMMQISPDMGAMRPNWLVYFAVDDVDAAARRATDLGGRVCLPLRDIPEVGRFCGIVSPQGVMFYLIAYSA
jgi:uncharacterized protein